MDEKGVYPCLMGGLGNQMFIIAAAHIISKVQDCPLYLTKNHNTTNPHNVFNLDYKKTIFQSFGKHLDITENDFLNWAFDQSYIAFQQNGFHPWDPQTCKPGTVIIRSCFQYYPPFAPYEEEIRNLFLEGLQPFQSNIENPLETAFLHIRRGDYLALSHVHFIQPIEYYEKGVEELRTWNPLITKINVFSDDIEWVKQQPFFQNPLFDFIEEANELKSLAFMSECKGGAVCANSTFSWWGAFLGCYEKRNPVIVPKRWICDPIYDLFPKEWIVLDV
jgi:hypothetical protein